MKLGVICDGISRDLGHALAVMDEFGPDWAELQFVGDAGVGDHTADQIERMRLMLEDRGKRVSCLSRHVFAGMTTANRPGDALHRTHMDALKRVIDMAHALDARLVRIMTSKKEQIPRGGNGAERWNVARGAWDTLPPLIAPAIEPARREGVTLVVETGNGTMVNSCYTARRLIDEMDAADALKVLRDPGNNRWRHERAWPDGYDELRGGYLGHVHIKDVQVDAPRATLEVRERARGSSPRCSPRSPTPCAPTAMTG